MKCPQCAHNQKYKEGMYCNKCGYQFIIDPKVYSLNDYKFKRIIEKTNQWDAWFFTPNQLYATYKRYFIKKDWIGVFAGLFGLLILIVGCITLIWQGDYFTCVLLVLFLLVLSLVVKSSFYPIEVDYWIFMDVWKLYGKHNRIPKLIHKPELKKKPSPTQKNEADLYDYGVEGVLVTDEDIYVDLLVRNNFHLSYKILIVSENSYPRYLQKKVEQILQDTPDLPVFLLHDATGNGVELQERIRNNPAFPIQKHPCIDLGLFPAQFQSLKILKPFKKYIHEDFAPLDFLSYKHFVAVFNKYILERNEKKAMGEEIEDVFVGSDMSWTADLTGDDFG